MLDRLTSFWVYGSALAGVLLLLLTPLFTEHWSPLMTATFLHLPTYMLHQFEEHDQDKFRLFFNQTIGQGREALSKLAVFITNVPGVWLIIATALYASSALHPGWCLIAVYLVLINALVHIAHAVLFRRYNPGLSTAITLFLPLGGYTLYLSHSSQAASSVHHIASLVLAILIHAAILVHVKRRVRQLQRAGTVTS